MLLMCYAKIRKYANNARKWCHFTNLVENTNNQNQELLDFD